MSRRPRPGNSRAAVRRRGAAVLAASVTTALAVSLCAAAVADDPDRQKKDVDSRISTAQQDYDGVSKQLSDAVSALNATNTKITVARAQVGRTQRELGAANRHHADVSGRLRVAQANETKSRKALAENAQAQARSRTLVGGLARSSYMQGGLGGLDTTMRIITGRDISSQDLSLADIVMRQQGGVMRTLGGQQAAGRAETTRLSGVRSQVAGLERQSQASLTRATKARKAAGEAQSGLEALQKRQRSDTDRLGKQKLQEKADLDWLKRESTRLGGVLKARAQARAKAAAKARADAAARAKKKDPTPAPAPQSPAPAQRRSTEPGVPRDDGHFLTGPRPKAQITSPFGYRMHPVLKVMRLHAGADFSFACGTPVYAAAAGDVVEAGFNSVGGNHVLLDHGEHDGKSFATQYDHLSQIVTRSGSVAKGQLVGYSGTTGRSTGCHLHFVVMVNGAYVNPASYIG